MTPIPSFPQIEERIYPVQGAPRGEGEWKVGMKRGTEKSLDEQRPIVAYLDGLQAKVNTLPALCSSGRLQSAIGKELRPFFGRTLMPSILDKAFKGEL